MQKRVPIPSSIPDGGQVAAEDDTALVVAARNDPAAFGKLYQLYRDRVYWYLLARSDNTEDAADLTQHVFLKAMDALAQYRPEKGPFVAWLFGIARNAATNFRQRGLKTIAWDLPVGTQGADTAQSLEETILHQESLDHLRRLCAALDPTKQELLALRFVAGLTSAEIGAVIGKSETATKKQLTRILQLLKERYHDLSV